MIGIESSACVPVVDFLYPDEGDEPAPVVRDQWRPAPLATKCQQRFAVVPAGDVMTMPLLDKRIEVLSYALREAVERMDFNLIHQLAEKAIATRERIAIEQLAASTPGLRERHGEIVIHDDAERGKVVVQFTEQTEAQHVFVMPEWNECEAREKSIADTSSAWRASALRSVGGWFCPSGMLDDYSTVLQLIHQGWGGQRVAKAVSVLRHHDRRRSRALETIAPTLWHARRHAILTLFAGRERPFPQLLDWYRRAELPPHTTLHWVDNSGSAAFHARLWRAAKILGSRPEITGINITRDDRRLTSGTFEAIHTHVASLYNTALRAMDADVIVTIEDDVIPPRDALPTLLAPLQPWTSTAGVAAVYPSRDNPRVANVALERFEWKRMLLLSKRPPGRLWR